MALHTRIRADGIPEYVLIGGPKDGSLPVGVRWRTRDEMHAAAVEALRLTGGSGDAKAVFARFHPKKL